MKSYVLSLVLKFVLPQGLTWLENSEIAHQAEIDAWFATHFAGKIITVAEKAVVDKAIPALLEQAKSLLKTYQSAESITEAEIFAAVSSVVKAVFA